MKIAVLAGGLSPERDVSLSSGSLIADALSENGHRVFLLDVYEGLRELPEDPDTLFRSDRKYEYRIPETVPDLDALRERCGNGSALIGKNVMEVCRRADLVFLALHGAMGENGQLQATLDSYGICYTGSGYAGSLLAMDKDLSKRLFRDAGIPTPDWVYYDTKEGDPHELDAVGFPCVVKPCGCGSSVGVSMADTREERDAALRAAGCFGRFVLVEKKIIGRELTVGILDGVALPPVEIIPEKGFYDYKNKYQGTTREVCPAEIPLAVVREISAYAVRGFHALRLHGYARFDFLMDSAEHLFCLEGNTLPGMTPTSLLPQAAAAVGISYRELCERIVRLA